MAGGLHPEWALWPGNVFADLPRHLRRGDQDHGSVLVVGVSGRAQGARHGDLRAPGSHSAGNKMNQDQRPKTKV